MSGYERKPLSLITTTAGMAATITAMIIGSLFGVSGTLWGAALGSGVSATAGTLYENAARKTHARLLAKREQEKADAHPDKHPLQMRIAETEMGHNALIRAREMRILGRRNPWKTAAIGAGLTAACFAIAIVTLVVIESASGRTLHSLTTGNNQYGSSFSYSTKAPVRPRVTPSATVATVPAPSPSSSSASPIADASPSISGGASSGLTGIPSSSPAASPTQSGATAPAANAGQSSSSTTVP